MTYSRTVHLRIPSQAWRELCGGRTSQPSMGRLSFPVSIYLFRRGGSGWKPHLTGQGHQGAFGTWFSAQVNPIWSATLENFGKV